MFEVNLENQTEHNDPDPDQDPEVGGRMRRKNVHNKTKSNKNVIVVGKVYADWCGPCQMLKPEWAKMKKHIYSKKGKKHVVFVEVEEKEIESKLRKLEKNQGVKIETNGYPTLFRIEGGNVVYYNGNRQSDEMSRWYLKGGESNQEEIPGILQDQHGGKYRSFGRRSFGRRSFGRSFKSHSNKHNYKHKESYKTLTHSRRNRTSKKGMFDFLFGSN